MRDTGDDGVGHSGVVAAGDRGGFQPPRNGSGIRVETENLVVVPCDQAGELTSQGCSPRRRALVIEQRDPFFDLVHRDG